MEGSIYKCRLPKKELLSWAMKQNGISKDLEKIIDNRPSAPRFGKVQETESLNVILLLRLF
jgi:TrmH family RNA methyltransferase